MIIFYMLAAKEYVESLEGCEGLADRLAHPFQQGQDEVLYVNIFVNKHLLIISFCSEHIKCWLLCARHHKLKCLFPICTVTMLCTKCSFFRLMTRKPESWFILSIFH